MGILLLKILLAPIAVIEGCCNIIVAFVMWDKRPLERDWLMDILWKRK